MLFGCESILILREIHDKYRSAHKRVIRVVCIILFRDYLNLDNTVKAPGRGNDLNWTPLCVTTVPYPTK